MIILLYDVGRILAAAIARYRKDRAIGWMGASFARYSIAPILLRRNVIRTYREIAWSILVMTSMNFCFSCLFSVSSSPAEASTREISRGKRCHSTRNANCDNRRIILRFRCSPLTSREKMMNGRERDCTMLHESRNVKMSRLSRDSPRFLRAGVPK